MSETTISQALRRVKKIKGELAEQLDRAKGAVVYKKGEEPAYSFSTCLEKSTTLRNELLELEARITLTNASNVISFDGKSITLAYAVKLLKELKGQIKWLDELKGVVRNKDITVQDERTYDYETEKHVTKQATYTCELPEAKRSALADEVKAKFDRLNDLVENMNHRVTLKRD